MNEVERNIIKGRKESYYATHWQAVLMRMLSFKKPMVANAHMITAESLKVDPTHPMYIHIAWVKPGRHTYCVSQEPENVYSSGDEGKGDMMIDLFMNKKVRKGKKSKERFYVHDMLATFREEPIPDYYNTRHLRVLERDKHKERNVF